MLCRQVGKVLSVVEEPHERPGVQEVVVAADGVESRAVNYIDLCGPVRPGDEVLLNTTAVELGLGTGGLHFVMANLSSPSGAAEAGPGHIMKMRYTPVQASVLAVEEDDSPYHSKVESFESLNGMPVVCCELHSQIAGVAAALKAATDGEARLVYVMTDGAALSLGLSKLVAELKAKSLLDGAVTCGQAFGGDLEAVNVYTGLIAAKEVLHADVAVVCQGPGNAGTNSKYGFSGIEQGEALNAAGQLGGQPIMVPRMSFADRRERHRGVSHHTLTILEKVVLVPALLATPRLPDEQMRGVVMQVGPVLQGSEHEICIVDAEPGVAELERLDIRVRTMGRSVQEDREFFLAAASGGALASAFVRGTRA